MPDYTLDRLSSFAAEPEPSLGYRAPARQFGRPLDVRWEYRKVAPMGQEPSRDRRQPF